jgi:hypothetical protein
LLLRSNSLTHYAKGTRSHIAPKGHSAPTVCMRHGFRFYFTPVVPVLFTFPSRYWFTIGHEVVFSLGRWASQLPTGFHVSRGTREMDPGRLRGFRIRGFNPLWPDFPDSSSNRQFCNFPKALPSPPIHSHDPHMTKPAGMASYGFRLYPFRSPLLRVSQLLSVPPGT